jgi:hypothetical protein
LAKVKSRGEVKALGARLDADAALRAAALDLLGPAPPAAPSAEAGAGQVDADGAMADENDVELDGKRLVRRLLDRAAGAQVRTNPIHRDEAFACQHCGADVPPGGAPVRDHCPRCLRSLHVDVVPGDRAAGCGGLLDPAALLLESGGQRVIFHKCRSCGAQRRVRAHPEDAWPPSLNPAELPGGSPAGRPSVGPALGPSSVPR